MSRDDEALLSDDTADLASNTTVPAAPAAESAAAPAPEPLEVMAAGAEAADDEAEVQGALQNLERRRAEKRRKKRIKVIGGCAIAGGLIAVLLGRSLFPAPSESEALVQETALVERVDFSDTVSASGALKAGNTVAVTPEVDGIIESIAVTEGQEVKEGDILLTLKNDSLDKAVRDARQDVQTAQDSVNAAQRSVSQATAARDDAWQRYNAEWSEADAEHSEWEYLSENYDELYASWQERKDTADDLACGKPVEPPAPTEPGSNATSDQIEQYKTDFSKYQDKYAQYLKDLEEYQAYQDALAAVGDEPVPAGEEPKYPDAPDDISLNAAIESAQDEVTSANQALTKAKEAYDEAVELADKRTVKAPAAGNVVALTAKVGEAVGGATGGTSDRSASTDTLVQISDVTKMSVDVEVNEIDILSIRKGQKAKVTFSAVSDLELDASVKEVSTVATGEGEGGGVVTFHVGLVIPHPSDKLRPGMTANVKINTVDVPNALVVPASAIVEGEEGATVEVVVDEETMETETRPVKVGARNSMQAVIEDGVKEGEVILLGGGSFDEVSDEELEG